MQISENLNIAIQASLLAGIEIMKIYNSDDFEVETKSDNSPLTKADKKSHDCIQRALEKTAIPILSEEGKAIPYEKRKNWECFWMIDPIDGTKEFIKRNGEFTVNIALIEGNLTTLGVVYAPALKVLYFSEKNTGSYKASNIVHYRDLDFEKVVDLNKITLPEVFTIVVSRSHMNDETAQFVNQKEKTMGAIETKSYGSSLKICKVAEGSAHCYPRFGPTMEWDTAAAHAVAKFSGCSIIESDKKTEIIYNKENLLNPYFIVERE